MTGAFNKTAVTLVLLVLAALTWWMPNALVAPTALFDQQTRHDPDYTIEIFTATAMDERGEKKYILSAKKLTHYPDDQTAHLLEPRLIQYQPGAAPVYTTADNGRTSRDQKYLLMTGNVRVTQGANGAGGELRTQELRVYLE